MPTCGIRTKCWLRQTPTLLIIRLPIVPKGSFFPILPVSRPRLRNASSFARASLSLRFLPSGMRGRDPSDFAIGLADTIATGLLAFQVIGRKRGESGGAAIGQNNIELEHVVDRFAVPDRARAG